MVLLNHVLHKESAKIDLVVSARYAVPHVALARFSRHALLAGTSSGSENLPWKEKKSSMERKKIFHGKKKSSPWKEKIFSMERKNLHHGKKKSSPWKQKA